MDKAIQTSGLTKIYGRKIGCKDIDLSIEQGQVFGLLGPNGAGKSTFVKILVRLIYPTSGTASLLGKPIGDVKTRAKIGFLPENFKYQEWLTGRELLSFHARLLRMEKQRRGKRIDEVLPLVGLAQAADAKIRTYSKGMQQRIGLACSLLSDPDLLFLDEPTSALDPLGRVEVREILSRLKDRGTTVFLNSHLLSEVEMVCDQVAVMKEGSIVAKGSLADLLRGKIEISLRTSILDEGVKEAIGSKADFLYSNENQMRLEVVDDETIAEIARIVVKSGASLYEISRHHRTLEELFLELVKEEA